MASNNQNQQATLSSASFQSAATQPPTAIQVKTGVITPEDLQPAPAGVPKKKFFVGVPGKWGGHQIGNDGITEPLDAKAEAALREDFKIVREVPDEG